MRKKTKPSSLLLILLSSILCFASSPSFGMPAVLLDTASFYTFGGTKTEEFRDMVITSDSGFALLGTTNGYGPGNSSVYLVRTDKNGQHIWSTVLGGSLLDQGSAILALSGGFMVAGSSNSFGNGGYDGYLCRTDINGNVVWEKAIGGSDWDFFHDMALLPDSTFIVCGESYSFSSGGTDAWVLRLDLQGNILWQKNFGTNGDDSFRGITILGNSIYLCGTRHGTDADGYLVKLDFSGQLVWEKVMTFYGTDYLNAIATTHTFELILVGGTVYTDSLNSDVWILRCDSNGNVLWTLPPGINPEDDYMNAVLVKDNGDIIATGMKSPHGLGGRSMFTIQIDSIGGSLQPHSFGGASDEEAFSCLITPDGGLAIAGSTNSYGNGDMDGCLVLVDSSNLRQDYVYISINFFETLSPVAIRKELISQNSIILYPNPTDGFLKIRIENSEELISCRIYSTTGTLVFEKDFTNIGPTDFDLHDLASGIYHTEFATKNRIISNGRFILNKK